jgi:hypothetical protein
MGSTTHSIDVNAPLKAVYNQWTQFEEFPHFMEGVIEVRQQGPKSLFWKVNVGGKEKQWEAEILEQIPDTRIVWESVDGTQNKGTINFESLDLEQTRITLTLDYEPEGLLEKAADVLGIPSGMVEGDLKRFRDFIQDRGKETGSWRGRIQEGESVQTPSAVNRPTEAELLDVTNGDRSFEKPGQIVASPPITAKEATSIPSESVTEEKDESPAFHVSASGLERSESLREEPTEPEEISTFSSKAEVLAPTEEQIAERAYELYTLRGSTHGHAQEDWLEAEKQLSSGNRDL